MNREELYAMVDEKLGYAYVYEKRNNGKYTDYLFSMTPKTLQTLFVRMPILPIR